MSANEIMQQIEKLPKTELYSVMIDVAEKKKTKADLGRIFRRCAEQEN